jgi:hypothetical protein
MLCRSTVRGLLMPLALLAASAHQAGAAPGIGLLPHIAYYRLSRHHADSDSGVVAVKGRMEVHVAISCDGFKLDQYLGFHIMNEDEGQLEHLAYMSSFEDADGRAFWFNTRTYENRVLVEEMAGVARVPATGPGETRYAQPRRATEALPEGTLFPVGHMKSIIDAARAGRKSVRHSVFDGSTRDNPFEISTFIGDRAGGSRNDVDALEGVWYWPVRLAYFSIGAVEPTPQFEMSANVYENGVIGNMIYDYGDFAIDVKLEDVKKLSAPEC